MNKVYQPVVIEKCNEIIQILKESNFFEDYEINDTEYIEKYLKDKLTTKFINGELDSEADADLEIFTEDEFEIMLREMVSGSILYELKKKGFVNSYDDENTEEMFFLTEQGKEYMRKNFE